MARYSFDITSDYVRQPQKHRQSPPHQQHTRVGQHNQAPAQQSGHRSMRKAQAEDMLEKYHFVGFEKGDPASGDSDLWQITSEVIEGSIRQYRIRDANVEAGQMIHITVYSGEDLKDHKASLVPELQRKVDKKTKDLEKYEGFDWDLVQLEELCVNLLGPPYKENSDSRDKTDKEIKRAGKDKRNTKDKEKNQMVLATSHKRSKKPLMKRIAMIAIYERVPRLRLGEDTLALHKEQTSKNSNSPPRPHVESNARPVPQQGEVPRHVPREGIYATPVPIHAQPAAEPTPDPQVAREADSGQQIPAPLYTQPIQSPQGAQSTQYYLVQSGQTTCIAQPAQSCGNTKAQSLQTLRPVFLYMEQNAEPAQVFQQPQKPQEPHQTRQDLQPHQAQQPQQPQQPQHRQQPQKSHVFDYRQQSQQRQPLQHLPNPQQTQHDQRPQQPEQPQQAQPPQDLQTPHQTQHSQHSQHSQPIQPPQRPHHPNPPPEPHQTHESHQARPHQQPEPHQQPAVQQRAANAPPPPPPPPPPPVLRKPTGYFTRGANVNADPGVRFSRDTDTAESPSRHPGSRRRFRDVPELAESTVSYIDDREPVFSDSEPETYSTSQHTYATASSKLGYARHNTRSPHRVPQQTSRAPEGVPQTTRLYATQKPFEKLPPSPKLGPVPPQTHRRRGGRHEDGRWSGQTHVSPESEVDRSHSYHSDDSESDFSDQYEPSTPRRQSGRRPETHDRAYRREPSGWERRTEPRSEYRQSASRSYR